MDAVIITGRQIGGDELAINKLCRHPLITCQQGVNGVVMTFSLENLIAINVAELADSAIRGQGDEIGIGIHRTRIVFQRTNEKVIKGAIAGGIGLTRFRHVDFVKPDKDVNDQFGQPTTAATGAPTGKFSQPFLRENMIQAEF